MDRLTLTGEAAALLELITKGNNLVSVSVKARLTPNESDIAVDELKNNNLVVVENSRISLTQEGKRLKKSLDYDIKGRVGANRIFRASGNTDNSNLITEKN